MNKIHISVLSALLLLSFSAKAELETSIPCPPVEKAEGTPASPKYFDSATGKPGSPNNATKVAAPDQSLPLRTVMRVHLLPRKKGDRFADGFLCQGTKDKKMYVYMPDSYQTDVPLTVAPDEGDISPIDKIRRKLRNVIGQSSDRSFSCTSLCTNSSNVCGVATTAAENRKKCQDFCGHETKRTMGSYDLNNYRTGESVLWGLFFEDVCASRPFNVANRDAYLRAHPDEAPAVAASFEPAMKLPSDFVQFLSKVAVGVYESDRDTAVPEYAAAGWDVSAFPGTAALGHGHIAGLVLGKGNQVIVVYHGTESAFDVLTDATFYKSTAFSIGVSGNMHSGFLSAFNSSWSDVKNLIRQYASKNNLDLHNVELIFTGHSLGAAVASIAALKATTDPDFLTAGRLNPTSNQVKLVTFASPGVFSANAAKSVESRIGLYNMLRFQFSGDPVTGIPPATVHVGTNIQLTPPTALGEAWQRFTSTITHPTPAQLAESVAGLHRSTNYETMVKSGFESYVSSHPVR